MKSNIKVKFPCGYEYNQDIKTGWFEFVESFEAKGPSCCPMHGKKCKRR